jgi:hypothetical protein
MVFLAILMYCNLPRTNFIGPQTRLSSNQTPLMLPSLRRGDRRANAMQNANANTFAAAGEVDLDLCGRWWWWWQSELSEGNIDLDRAQIGR